MFREALVSANGSEAKRNATQPGVIVHNNISNMKNLLAFLITLYALSCSNNNSVDSPYSEIPDTIIIEVSIFEPKLKTLPILDSITDVLNKCPVPKGKITEVIIFVERQTYGFEIYLTTISDYHWVYTNTNGVFKYNEYNFYYYGLFLEELFEKTKNKVKLTVPNPEKLYFDTDERCYKWAYAFKEGILEGILVKDCNKLWVNWDYYPGED